MVLNYQKKTVVQYDEEKKRETLKELRREVIKKMATKKNGLPIETLQQWAKNEPSHLGSGSIQPVLTSDQEEMNT